MEFNGLKDKTVMFLLNAKKICNVVRETYSKVKDVAHILMIKRWSTKKGNTSATECLNLLKNWWQKLDQYYYLTMNYRNAAHLKQYMETYRAYKFMAGLMLEFDQIIVQILEKKTHHH